MESHTYYQCVEKLLGRMCILDDMKYIYVKTVYGVMVGDA